MTRMNNYTVILSNGTTHTIRASMFQAYGGDRGVTFIRETPGTDPNWDPEYGPQVVSTPVAYFKDVESIIIEDNSTEE